MFDDVTPFIGTSARKEPPCIPTTSLPDPPAVGAGLPEMGETNFFAKVLLRCC